MPTISRRELSIQERWRVIGDSAAEVGPALFFSLLIITLSFIPVFTLEAQEGRLFSPLAFTKTYSMAAAAGLSALVPVLMGYMIRGTIPSDRANPLNRWLIRGYQPLLKVLTYPKTTLAIAAMLLVATAWPIMRIGGEFMPPLDEGDLLYMPSALPGLSAGKAAQLLQQTDRLIKTVPEVTVAQARRGARTPPRIQRRLNVRDHHSVQAQGPVARGHDHRQAGRRARSRCQSSRTI
jgi:Cu(I)/Ag(I) efflux system membrane protein CusA/SilA